MKKVTKSIFLIAVLVMMSVFSITAHAEPSNLVKFDYYLLGLNKFDLYISESEDQLGVLIKNGPGDASRIRGSANLDPKKTHYLHIVATMETGNPYIVGIFNLNGKLLNFSNNSNELKTNPTDFIAYKDGYGKTQLKVNYITDSRPTYIDGAKYIIAEGGKGKVFFSTTISPVESPLKVQASSAKNSINLSWNSIPGAVSYSVERFTTAGGPYAPIASDLTETNYTDKNVVANTTYYYIVKAKLSDTETVTSSEVSGTPTSETPTVDSKLKVVLEPEEKLQLSVDDHLDENANMTWTSSDSTVAQVDANGVVTAIKAGNAVIHVQSQDENYSDDINILVVDNADDYRLAVDLKVGKTSRLTIDDLTNTLNVTWDSSDATVATVSSKGVVTAKGKGLTLAKATDRDGNVVGQVYVRVRE
ncbi:Ig-like domain-containing protein [Lacrimispora algidixylanolytica]|uniref:Fibronectin type-III domain-containing protein n=1 Tax=Lacrimispora algidixylanolytica TaxID=94868 RepID=A0A419T1L0_9FIRM|nr:Ig-like domain-containing protein [Lacrimispora algidixylanolytica]RKD31319.1 hypothetical protein BET01_20965 [Lacrimispora algidixylanolytica]